MVLYYYYPDLIVSNLFYRTCTIMADVSSPCACLSCSLAFLLLYVVFLSKYMMMMMTPSLASRCRPKPCLLQARSLPASQSRTSSLARFSLPTNHVSTARSHGCLADQVYVQQRSARTFILEMLGPDNLYYRNMLAENRDFFLPFFYITAPLPLRKWLPIILRCFFKKRIKSLAVKQILQSAKCPLLMHTSSALQADKQTDSRKSDLNSAALTTERSFTKHQAIRPTNVSLYFLCYCCSVALRIQNRQNLHKVNFYRLTEVMQSNWSLSKI